MYLNLLTKKIIKYTYTLRPSFSFNFFNSSKDKFDNSKKIIKANWEKVVTNWLLYS